jgi:hypothetical protein
MVQRNRPIKLPFLKLEMPEMPKRRGVLSRQVLVPCKVQRL